MTPKAQKIKKALEEAGQVEVKVWWEPVTAGCEMGGPEGGWFFTSQDNSVEPLGCSVDEALSAIKFIQ